VPERGFRERAIPRHELPEIDAAALSAARALDRLVAEARRLADAGSREADRWAGYFGHMPDELRDDPLPRLRALGRRARAAYGPKDSVRDVLPLEVTEPALDSIDRLLKVIARFEAHRA
jgi:hypothetical protein